MSRSEPPPEGELALYEPLAEGGRPDDETPVPILDGARHDLRRARAAAIDHDDEGKAVVRRALGGEVLLAGAANAPLRVDDELAAADELVRDLDGLVQVAARVAAKVQDELLHALALEVREGFFQLVGGRGRETAGSNEADVLGEHEVIGDALDRDLGARDREVKELLATRALDPDRDLGAGAAAELFHDLRLGDSDRALAFDLHDSIARADAQLVGGEPSNGLMTVRTSSMMSKEMPMPEYSPLFSSCMRSFASGFR